MFNTVAIHKIVLYFGDWTLDVIEVRMYVLRPTYLV